MARWTKGQSGNPKGRPLGKKSAKTLPPKPEKKKRNKLYLIRCHSYYKIGVSRDPERRLDVMQSNLPYKLHLELVVPIGERAVDVEQYLHNYFCNKKVRGEWYKLSHSDIKEIQTMSFDIDEICPHYQMDLFFNLKKK